MKSILSQAYTPQNLTLHVTVKSRNQSLFLKKAYENLFRAKLSEDTVVTTLASLSLQ